VQPERPYVQFNFVVELGDGDADGSGASFEEVTGLGITDATGDSRSGVNGVVGHPATGKLTDITLKRGVSGSSAINKWLRAGSSAESSAYRTVIIGLQNAERNTLIQRWKLLRARVIKCTSSAFDGKEGMWPSRSWLCHASVSRGCDRIRAIHLFSLGDVRPGGRPTRGFAPGQAHRAFQTNRRTASRERKCFHWAGSEVCGRQIPESPWQNTGSRPEAQHIPEHSDAFLQNLAVLQVEEAGQAESANRDLRCSRQQIS
jgi:phage tail-like protein